jgi:hypothetical protein
MEIKKITITKGCFSESIDIDGKDFNDIPREDIIQWMTDKIRASDSYSFEEFFKNIAWSDGMHNSVYHDTCDQCGDWNSKDELTYE